MSAHSDKPVDAASMPRPTRCFVLLLAGVTLAMGGLERSAAGAFRVATYNVENYLLQPTQFRPHAKSAAARAKVRESIRALHPDVLVLQEIGGLRALQELRTALKHEGLDYPYWELVNGWDTNIHVAVLSRLRFVGRHPHTNDAFLLGGRRFRVSRGIAELEVRAAPGFDFILLAVHLKSRRPEPNADEAEQRLQEARILRRIVSERLTVHPAARLIVLGDFNDLKDSPSLKEIIGRGRFKLIDTRPAEQNGDNTPNPVARFEPRNITWTHYYGKEDTYSRVDYLLLSPAMARFWVQNDTYVLTLPNWGIASDHRPLVATFRTEHR